MHIPDGVLPVTVCAGGYFSAAAATKYCLHKIEEQDNPQRDIPKAALLTAAFFVASWVHVPLPPTSVHLILNGLMGILLGYYAFPAILIGLFFQALMFQHGGLTTLGVNATLMGIPALLAWLLFRVRARWGLAWHRTWTALFAFFGAALGLGLAALALSLLLILTIPGELNAAVERAAILTVLLAHLPLMAIEGAFSAMLVTFLMRVQPDFLLEIQVAHA